jgi:Domain of unknown function (DUF932)
MTTNTILRAKPGESLTLDEMRASLPSIFGKQAHESRSEKYVYISTEDMLERLVGAGFLPVEARMSRTRDENRIGYTKHMLRLRSRRELNKPENSTMSKLGVAFEVILRNAHDGSGSYQLLAGLIRFACENGLVVSDGTVAQVKVYHIGDRERLMAEVTAGAQKILEEGPHIADMIRAFKAVPLVGEDRTRYAKQAHRIRFADPQGNVTTPISPEQLLLPRRPSDVGGSLWDTFNVVQENIIHGGMSASGVDSLNRRRKFIARPIRAIDQDVSINSKLWQLTTSWAKELA